MSYRPEGWTNEYASEHRAFEAGADAILEALKREGEYLHNTGLSPYGYVLVRSLKRGEKGYLIFIPGKNLNQ